MCGSCWFHEIDPYETSVAPTIVWLCDCVTGCLPLRTEFLDRGSREVIIFTYLEPRDYALVKEFQRHWSNLSDCGLWRSVIERKSVQYMRNQRFNLWENRNKSIDDVPRVTYVVWSKQVSLVARAQANITKSRASLCPIRRESSLPSLLDY